MESFLVDVTRHGDEKNSGDHGEIMEFLVGPIHYEEYL
jgi:hypothetical protein